MSACLEKPTVKAPQLDTKCLQRFEKLLPLFVFLFSLAIRLFFDLNKSDQRLCSFGDGYFFLKTGQELAKALVGCASFSDFLIKLTVHTSEVAGGVATFGSGALGDRLLLDGPVYTSFLALVHILSGIVTTTDYANNSRIFSVANSIIDAFSCVLVFLCGRMAFGRKAGLIAALLLSIYPASVLNTRLCYGELFTYFLFLLWSTLVLGLNDCLERAKPVLGTVYATVLGAVSVLILLAKSLFAPLPVIGLLVLFTRKETVSKPKFLGVNAAAIITGAVIVMAPWLWFTHEVTGKFTPWVNRAPGYNLFVGNQLYTDGWRTWPAQDGIPNEASVALKSLGHNFSEDPLQFSALQLRKVSRLWGGVWNDFQHRFFGIGWQVQNVFHDMILAFAVLGFIVSLKASEAVRRNSIVFAAFAAFHSLYAGFEPVARYAISAMPFACLLAANGLAGLTNPLKDRRFYVLLIFSIVFFTALDRHFSFIPQLFAVLPTDMWTAAALLDGAIWIALWMVLAFFLVQLIDAPTRFQRGLVWTSAITLSTVSIANLVYDPARAEWSAELKRSGEGVSADIILPSDLKNPPPLAYLLVDMQTVIPAPQVTVTVNEKIVGAPLPVLQLMKNRSDASEIFALQGQAMMVDPRSYRSWWAFPVPITYLSPSSPNKISILAKVQDGIAFSPVKIFGAYPTTEEEIESVREHAGVPQGVRSICMPSINKFSWVKGFVTIDRRDPRTYEYLKVRGLVRNCELHTRRGVMTADLSERAGRQFGSYRVRLYMPPNTTPEFDLNKWSAQSENLFVKDEEMVISGGDPSTMSLTAAPIALPPSPTSSAFYSLDCELQRVKQKNIGAITVALTAVDESGAELKYSSPWAPTSLTLDSKEWQKFSFTDRVPETFKNAHDIKASIMISPFAADRLFLHKKNALRDCLKVRNVNLSFYSQYAPPLFPIDEAYLY